MHCKSRVRQQSRNQKAQTFMRSYCGALLWAERAWVGETAERCDERANYLVRADEGLVCSGVAGLCMLEWLLSGCCAGSWQAIRERYAI